MPRFDEDEPKKIKKQLVNDSVIPKKSKKNKYFFIAHPEALDKKDQVLSDQNSKKKFVIDEEKITSNQLKKQKKQKNKPENKKKLTKKLDDKNKNKKLSTKLWLVEECSSEEEEEDESKNGFKSKSSKNQILDLDDIDRCFNVKKTLEKLDDGTLIEVFKPEIIKTNDDNDDETINGEESQEVSQDKSDNENDSHEEEEEKNEEKTNKQELPKNKMMEKLQSSRFRYLNELLYTQPSTKSYEFFENDKESFKAYHEGFKAQVDKWPMNPLDQIIKYIKSRPANLIVADFGCGEARLAQSVKNKVYSFDLVAVNEFVTKCDMKSVPLDSASCDIVVFCLSLMGTNVVDFLCEAHRVLKPKGVLKIAEVVSRIEDKGTFIKNVESIGFKLVSKKDEIKPPNTKDYFYFFDLVKMTPTVKKKPQIKLTPCLYKKR